MAGAMFTYLQMIVFWLRYVTYVYKRCIYYICEYAYICTCYVPVLVFVLYVLCASRELYKVAVIFTKIKWRLAYELKLLQTS